MLFDFLCAFYSNIRLILNACASCDTSALQFKIKHIPTGIKVSHTTRFKQSARFISRAFTGAFTPRFLPTKAVIIDRWEHVLIPMTLNAFLEHPQDSEVNWKSCSVSTLAGPTLQKIAYNR